MKRGYAALVATVTLLVYLGSSLPYLYGYWRQTAEERFTGIVFDVPDTAQYYAWMRAFARAPLIANPLTPEPGAERFFNLQWWLLAPLTSSPLGMNGAYQILRIIALAGFAVVLAVFCHVALGRHRAPAFALAMGSSGFGWALVVAKQWTGELRNPLSVQIAEANTFFSAMAFPHLLVAGALLLGVFCAFLQAGKAAGADRWRWSVLAAGLALALGFSHGYDLIPAMAIPGALVALLTLRRRRLPALARPAAAIVAGAAAPALYVFSLTRLDDIWRGVLSQYGNAGVFTPAPPQLIILLGLPSLLALWQLRPAAWSTEDPGPLFLRVWLIVGLALMYLPTAYQIKMLTTYQVPVCLLAALTLEEVRRALIDARRAPPAARGLLATRTYALPALVVVCALLTNVYLTAWRVIDLRRATYPYYLSAGDVGALEALAAVAAPGQVVLSSPELGVFVPVYSDARPFVAHWAQTLRFYARREVATRVYTPATTESERRALLQDNGIAFVLAGPAEAALGGATTPPPLALQRIAGAGDGNTSVYQSSSPASGAQP